MIRSRHYWVGIDEAGYGPNLGPLVVTAMVARGGPQMPDLWADLKNVKRTHETGPDDFCIDDSKRVMQRSDSLARMNAAFHAVVDTVCPEKSRADAPEARLRRLTDAFGPDVFGGDEIAAWTDPAHAGIDWFDTPIPRTWRKRLACRRWRVVGARIAVVGPAKFNGLLSPSCNKSDVNAMTFLELVAWLRGFVPEGAIVHVTTDRHGGRHFYGPVLAEAFPGRWIDKRHESAKSSRYRIQDGAKSFEFSFDVSADVASGLVALSSMMSKLMRERWMRTFNAWFARRVPDLRPTAGYPVDAKRFLEDIETYCRSVGMAKETFWRLK